MMIDIGREEAEITALCKMVIDVNIGLWQSLRVAKCHGYDRYIRIKFHVSVGKKSGVLFRGFAPC